MYNAWFCNKGLADAFANFSALSMDVAEGGISGSSINDHDFFWVYPDHEEFHVKPWLY